MFKSLYFAFVRSHLLYGIEVYGNSSQNHLNKLIILIKKLLHIVRNKSLRTPVIELCRNFNTGTLPLPQLHQFQLWYFCLVHKYLHCNSQLPVVFSKYFTLNNDIHHYNTRSTENLHLTRVSTAREARNVKFKAS